MRQRKDDGMKNFRERLKRDFIILDGATGTNLQEQGMPSGVCPESWILENPDVFLDLQKQYIQAGSDVLYTPTFTCNRIKLAEYGLAQKQSELTEGLVALSKRAIVESGTKRDVYIAGDITMTGEQLYPMGTLTFEELVDIYKEQVSCLLAQDVDLFVIETMMSLNECRAALLAVKESCDLPVIVTLTYEADMRTLYGTTPETAMVVLESMGADAVGLNCSTGPDQMVEAVRQMNKYANVPIVVKPNAGLPTLVDGKTCYSMGPQDFAQSMIDLADAGATVLGGCCGTTPEHIRKMVETIQKKTPIHEEEKSLRVLTTEHNVTPIELDGPFMIVGERINPTGKKELQAQLREGNFDLVTSMAEEQVKLGAKVLDVNMGMNGIDEKERMLEVVHLLTQTVEVPLSIDSSDVKVVEAALRIYPGRALINSISLEPEKFQKLIPLAKKYGTMFILLPLSEKGLPENLQEKKEIIHVILEEAKRHGLSESDIIVDGLVTTVGSNKNAAREVFETIRHCKEDLHLATICGLSNISFGLPERTFVNSAFVTMAIQDGLTMAIANPSQDLLVNATLASDLLLNKEEADVTYIENVVTLTVDNQTQSVQSSDSLIENKGPIYEAVVKGRREKVLPLVDEELNHGTKPARIIDDYLIAAINQVGQLFEEKKYYLPQLIASAETMELAIGKLEPLLEQERSGQKMETIIVATVKGDIHDIGKNLVALMLKNYGYHVIDLGKDVDSELIVKTAKEQQARIIGLSALMTTTMMAMKDVVDLAKQEELDAKVIIGGAAVTDSFAEEIGADGYSKDAQEAVKLVNRLLHKEG